MNADAAAARRHQPFRFKSAEGLLRKAHALGIDLPFDEKIGALFQPVTIGSTLVPNRLAVQPMEGCDGGAGGAPGELTFRRYRRYGAGGSGLIWFEATAVVPEGRSNPHALLLGPGTQASFRALVDETRRAAAAALGPRHRPFLVLQLTHAGRYSMADGTRAPRCACANPHLDQRNRPAAMWRDEELDQLGEVFIDRARLAMEAGFDAVDIKACHGYLVSELLGAHTRSGSRYGGSLENRSRLLMNVVTGIRQTVPGLTVAVRLNASDLVPYPYGFGMTADGSDTIDLAEPRALVRQLVAAGCGLINVTAGNPRCAPYAGRPFDRPAAGTVVPPEHPLIGVARLIRLAAAVREECGSVPAVGSGYSWLRRFWPNVGAAIVARGMADIVGLGRHAFAYPDAPRDLMTRGAIESVKCCTACSRCVELMRSGIETGCVVRDRPLYRQIHRAHFG